MFNSKDMLASLEMFQRSSQTFSKVHGVQEVVAREEEDQPER